MPLTHFLRGRARRTPFINRIMPLAFVSEHVATSGLGLIKRPAATANFQLMRAIDLGPSTNTMVYEYSDVDISGTWVWECYVNCHGIIIIIG